MTGRGDGANPRGDAGGAPSPLLRGIGWAVAALDVSGRLIAATLLGFMFLALLTNVVLRYAFGSGVAWAYEIHAVLLPWVVAGGMVIAAAQGRNIVVTLVPEMAGPRAARLIAALAQALVVAICLGVLLSSQPILRASQFQTLSTLGIRQIWGYASLVYAFAGMALIAALEAVRLLAGGATARDPAAASLS